MNIRVGNKWKGEVSQPTDFTFEHFQILLSFFLISLSNRNFHFLCQYLTDKCIECDACLLGKHGNGTVDLR